MFGLPWVVGAAEPKPDPGNDREPEKETVPVPSLTKV